MRTAVFDLDGTLADTAADLIAAANAACALEGLPPLDPAAERAVAGHGGRAMIRRAMALAGRPEDAGLVERLVPPFLAAYEARIAEETRLFPGAEAALDALAAAGWRLALCTNKPERLALLLLDALGARDRFGGIVGADTLPVRKPDPRPFSESVRRAGGHPGAAVMIGDTDTDRDTARNAGAPCVLMAYGYSGGAPERLAPYAVAPSLAALPAILDRALPLPLDASSPAAL